jgi:hypothetical protein
MEMIKKLDRAILEFEQKSGQRPNYIEMRQMDADELKRELMATGLSLPNPLGFTSAYAHTGIIGQYRGIDLYAKAYVWEGFIYIGIVTAMRLEAVQEDKSK